MNKLWRYISGEIAWLSFVTFFLLALLDDLVPGFVSLYFSPAIFLVSSGLATAVWLGLTLKASYD